jgi:lysyl-tRNA synthetase class 2
VWSGDRLLVGDAMTTVTARLRDGAPELSDGTLVVVSGIVGAGALDDATIEAAHPCTAEGADDVARLRDRGVGATLAARARALAAVRAYFEAEGFLEVETPAMVPSPGLDRHLDAFEIAGAEPPRFLITSPEYQMKRLLVGGIPRCFQIARCFRRGEVGGRHNPEFTMLEWYRAFADAEEVVRDTEEIVRAVAGAFGDRDALVVGARRIALDRPFVRTTVAQAFRDHAGVEEHEMLAWANDDEETFFRVLVDRVEPRLASLDVPVVLHRYPAKMASLARLAPDDPRYAERFEVYVAGLELSNGFGELTDPVEQRARFERDRSERRAAGQPVYPIDERFLAALASGMPPSAGNALGLDRLVMLGASKDEIGDVLALPEGVL